YKILERYSFIAKRDFFSFVHFVFALANQFDLLYIYTVGGLHLIFVGVVISQRKMLAHHHEQNGSVAPSGSTQPVGVAATPESNTR
ncbi:MAG: hypothetical protein HOH74_11245, partial [Gemmatimonadetes bacterium]|nr:hypothetical protein [Gemmatimonadota bacterium]